MSPPQELQTALSIAFSNKETKRFFSRLHLSNHNLIQNQAWHQAVTHPISLAVFPLHLDQVMED